MVSCSLSHVPFCGFWMSGETYPLTGGLRLFRVPSNSHKIQRQYLMLDALYGNAKLGHRQWKERQMETSAVDQDVKVTRSKCLWIL